MQFKQRWRRPGRRAVLAADLDRADDQLLQVVDAAFAAAAQRAGSWMPCGPGCSDCCHKPFPITTLDARRLGRGLIRLERTDPQRAQRLVRRAQETCKILSAGFPGDPQTGALDPEVDPATLDRFLEQHPRLPCPVLDPESGRCELHPQRPVACRSFGPPLSFGQERSEPCRLCFDGASSEEVEKCRVEIDPDGLEQALLSRIGVAPGSEWATLIAFAVAQPGTS